MSTDRSAAPSTPELRTSGSPPVDFGSRITSLDGLRGYAALVVVVFHALLTVPPLADVLRQPHEERDWVAVLAYSPLRLLWSGDEAVRIFFVLSGLALTMPFLNRRFDWSSYYPRRIIRLYLPVWASIVLAVVWWVLIPRESSPSFSWWTNAHDAGITPIRLFADTVLLFGTTWLNSPLWTLQWEVWFSILLPLYLWLLVRHRRGAVIKAVVLLAMLQLGHAVPGVYALKYLPTFGLGVLIAAHLDQLRELVNRTRPPLVAVSFVAGLALLMSHWLTFGRWSTDVASTIGAAVVVTLFAVWRPVMTFGRARIGQWLGQVSFSLYLVHEPIIVSVTMVLQTSQVGPVLLVALPLSLLVAMGFYRLVELPSLRLSQAVSRVIRDRRRPAGPPAPASAARAEPGLADQTG